MAHFVLKTIDGVERAAIISAIPAAHGHTQMLDLGANTKATPEQLRQFAAMGAITAQSAIIIASRMNKQCEAIRYLLFSDKRFLSMIVLLNVSAEVRCRFIRCRDS